MTVCMQWRMHWYPARACVSAELNLLAQEAVLADCGGAQTCDKSPGSADFQRELRKQIYASNFTGLTGPMSLTQCPGVDWANNTLGLQSSTDCGDRQQVIRSFKNWNGSSYVSVTVR